MTHPVRDGRPAPAAAQAATPVAAPAVAIVGGTIVDGTGGPAYTGDLLLDGGRIAAVGRPAIPDGADRVDATGLVVAPGFVDLHTHFDAQIFWDPDLTPSCWHGVTTVVQGNTGFGIAPTHPFDRDHIMETLENVEGMNLQTLRAGVPWGFETFPEYVRAVDALPKRLNVATFVGHTPLRMYVMGFEDATSREATAGEIDQMATLLEGALAAGAIGFSTSQAPSHMGALGRPVPSRLASRQEIEALLRVVARSDNPLVEITYGPQYELEDIARLSKELGVRITWGSLLTRLFGPPGVAMGMLDAASAVGGDVWPQVSCREIVSQTMMTHPYYFGMVPAFGELFQLPRDQRAAKYRDPAWRERVKAEVGDYRPDFARLASIQETTVHHDLVDIPLEDLARDRGVHPFDLMVDLALEEDLATRYRIVSLNDNAEELATLLRDPRIVLGAHDAGAHADMLCDASYPTHLLGHWVRDEKVLTLEEAVWRLSGQPAEVFGLDDRGRLAPGLAADVVVFDPHAVRPRRLERVNDLPGGGERLISRSDGVRGVWVNGRRVLEDGRAVPGAHPGALIGA
ncbi:MAG TPA: amidohydrolase family protein [Acidimicrobiales bacterium]|nr:amidohydrolase family protein [Acidimicrobiales bacterium]